MLILIWFFLTGMLKIIFFKKNLLNSLISLELMALSLSFTLILFSGGSSGKLFLGGLLTLIVCEAALGLAILVIHVRSQGSSMMIYSSTQAW